jgi:hypothetical protein
MPIINLPLEWMYLEKFACSTARTAASTAHLKCATAYKMALYMSDDSNSEFERKLQGRTLYVYLYLQKKKAPSGIREVQRDLGLSSPSVAEYQVEKLVEMGLASRDSYGRVFVTRKVKVKALESYVNFGRFTVPRLAFYASIFTTIAALYAVLSGSSLSIYGVLVPAAAAAVFWFEAYRMWKYNLVEKAKPKVKEASDHFWVSLMPGIAALAVFLAASFFLFYYVEPNGLVVQAPPPVDDPASQLPASTYDRPMTIDESVQMSSQKVAAARGDSSLPDFSPVLLTVLLFAGALVAGFLVYLLFRYRCGGVLVPEQGWN